MSRIEVRPHGGEPQITVRVDYHLGLRELAMAIVAYRWNINNDTDDGYADVARAEVMARPITDAQIRQAVQAWVDKADFTDDVWEALIVEEQGGQPLVAGARFRHIAEHLETIQAALVARGTFPASAPAAPAPAHRLRVVQ